MAKKLKEGFGSDVDEVFDLIDSINPEASFLDQSTLSKVTKWIDTGCYALNAICSGSLYKGIPSGRITGFSGPQACGKTFIMNKIVAKAQEAGRFVVGYDTEVAVDESSLVNVGGNPKRYKHVPIETIGEARNQINKFLDSVIEKKLQGKFAIVIDSLGNLISEKEKKDIEEGKDASEMGQRAKQLKSMLRSLVYKAAKADVPVLFSNHIYGNPAELHPTLVKQQSGGSGPLYLASLLVQLATKSEKTVAAQNSNKDATETANPIARGVNGITIRALTVKNRFAPPFLEAEMYLNFSEGLNRYTGLLALAEGYGAILKSGHSYVMEGGKSLGFYKNWRHDVELWEKTICPVLEKKLQEKLKFNNATEPEEIETDEEETTDEV
jgi:RecA/RadA recombinase